MSGALTRILVIALGAGLGANLRYWVANTTLVNLTGCFAMGLLMALSLRWTAMPSLARLFLFVGVLGGYTTFSAFGWETYAMAVDGLRAAAFRAALLQVAGGLAAVWAGASLASFL